MREIVIGTRGSQLALRQAGLVQAALESSNDGLRTRVKAIRTSGDKLSRISLPRGSTSLKGLFVKEIEEALLEKHIDLAIHSLKDLPGETPPELCLGAVPKREDPRDVMAAFRVSSLEEVPRGVTVGTSSLRRQVQLRFLRPDLRIETVRGNVDTRLRKVEEKILDGVVLAAAGLRRLGLENKISFAFSAEQMIPAIGQGALALEVRCDDPEIHEMVARLDHAETRICVTAERTFLREMGGGCHVPMGAHAALSNGSAVFSAFVGDPSTLRIIKEVLPGPPEDLDALALQAADRVLSRGAAEILREFEG